MDVMIRWLTLGDEARAGEVAASFKSAQFPPARAASPRRQGARKPNKLFFAATGLYRASRVPGCTGWSLISQPWSRAIWIIARSASAVMVNNGWMPNGHGTTAPSQT